VNSDEIAREITRTRRAVGCLEEAAERLSESIRPLYAAQRISGLHNLFPIYLGPGSEKLAANLPDHGARLLLDIRRATKRLETKIEELIEESRLLNRRPEQGGRNTKGRTIH
jgi:hypothetical protein